jgi:protocatechuate 3,4-dioxygenase beta subunit
MRRFGIVLVVLAFAAAAAWVSWPRPESPAGDAHRTDEPDFARVAVQAQGSEPGLVLSGVVRDGAGAPVRDALVSLAASEQLTVTSLRCGVCGEWLLSCRAKESARSVASLLERGRGTQVAALSTRSDEEGRFRFERLLGTSFTVWGEAQGWGRGVVERAAPGDPVALFLPPPRRLEGRLLDELRRPVRGSVRAISRRFAQAVEVQTDAQGGFAFEGLGEGPFALSATAPGHQPALVAEAMAGGRPVEVLLAAARRLEVRVLRDGNPVDAVLSLEGPHLARQLTVKGGLLAVDGLYPLDIVAVATAGPLASAPHTVSLDKPSTAITLQLGPAGTVAATVVDEAGQPVEAPQVELLTPSFKRIAMRRLQTGELGIFGPIAHGEYLLRAEARGFEVVTQAVTIGAPGVEVELVLARGVSIAGRVVDEYGRPAPGVSVLVGPLGQTVHADAEGRFLAPVPSPGRYALHAHHSDWGGIDRHVDAPATAVELQLEPRAGVAVTVVAEGQRLEGASATLFYDEGSFRSDRPSGADGVVLMRGLPPGNYSLVAAHPAWLASKPMPLALRDGELVRAEVELGAGASLSGMVVDTADMPVAGVVVQAAPQHDASATTDAEGKFSIAPVEPGRTYVLRIKQRGLALLGRVTARAGDGPVRLVVERQPVFTGRVLGAGEPLTRFSIDGQEMLSADGRFEVPTSPSQGAVRLTIEAAGFEPLSAARPAQPDLGDFNLVRASSFSGRVRDEAGAVVPGATVTCDTCEQSTRTDAQGRFSLARPWLQREFTVHASKGKRSGARKVEATQTDGVEVVLRAPVRISGVVYDAAGQAAAGVEVVGIRAERNETLTAVTGSDGSYSVDAAPGLYTFQVARRAGRADVEQSRIVMVEGRDLRLDFGRAPGSASLTVRLTPRRGWALYVVPGELSAVGNPPTELLQASGVQLFYQPSGERLLVAGLAPGRYTLVWGSFYEATDSGPLLAPVVVPAAGEIELVR